MRGQGPGQGPGGGAGGGFTGAARLVDAGRYGEALPALRCHAARGEGFEIAQYLAGYSALKQADAEETPDILRDELRVEGFDRLTLAAQAGWPAAQAELAEALALVDTPTAREDAAYWAEVYRHNRREQAYGLDRLDDGVEAQIAATIDADTTQAVTARAAAFTTTPLERQDATPECAPYLREERRGGPGGPGDGGRGRPPGGGRGGPGGGPGGGPNGGIGG
ncbi:hypothetical protein [Maricaulis parjimensis]|uniref:hypothetical protein n=1 Tax=Maricaulis parjimensis TaxID=144023 RepID=UPI001939A13E|nr:hypothetical protein [Maricaulis parjimensis]